MTLELGYWKVRGIAGGIKVFLEYTGEKWTDTFYEAHALPDGEWDRTEWTNDKFSEKFQNDFSFPNLPWLRDGDIKITQSSAIFKYISRKHGIGQNLNIKEAARVDQAEDQIKDIRAGFVALIYEQFNPCTYSVFLFKDRKEYCDGVLLPQLSQLSLFLEGSNYISGENITFVDFMLWEFLDHLKHFDSSLFDDPRIINLKNFKARIENVPKVANYLKSPRYMKGPCYSKMAKWGADEELKSPE